MEIEQLKFDQWCILEIMGHQRFAGRVTEQTIGGSAFLRIDIPATAGKVPFTKYFSAASVYAITPVTEEIAVGVAATLDNAPISVWDLPPAMREKLKSTTALPSPKADDDEDDSDDDYYDGPI